jgi:hypothetical protein
MGKTDTMTKEQNEMSYNDIADQILVATCKLEQMTTMLGVLIEMVEKEVSTPEQAMFFAASQKTLDDFLHITYDGVYDSIQILDRLQKGGAV